MNDWRLLLSAMWHRTFGEVKCNSFRYCPVCRDTDWPLASWVIAAEQGDGGEEERDAATTRAR